MCEEEPSLCYLLRPCVNGGTCFQAEDTYKCLCPWGYGGVDCQRNLAFDSSIGFRGDGHLLLEPPGQADKTLTVHVTVSTEDSGCTLVKLTAANGSAYFEAFGETFLFQIMVYF